MTGRLYEGPRVLWWPLITQGVFVSALAGVLLGLVFAWFV